MGAIFDYSSLKALGTILAIFVLVLAGLVKFFIKAGTQREDLIFWLKFSVVFSAILAVILWALLVIYQK